MPKGSVHGAGKRNKHKRYTGQYSNVKGTYSEDIEDGRHIRVEDHGDHGHAFHETVPQNLTVKGVRRAVQTSPEKAVKKTYGKK